MALTLSLVLTVHLLMPTKHLSSGHLIWVATLFEQIAQLQVRVHSGMGFVSQVVVAVVAISSPWVFPAKLVLAPEPYLAELSCEVFDIHQTLP